MIHGRHIRTIIAEEIDAVAAPAEPPLPAPTPAPEVPEPAAAPETVVAAR